MPTNKNALLRYLTLDKCFQNRNRKYFIENLMDACSESLQEFNPSITTISKRTIQNDISFMKSIQGFGAPIQTFYDSRKAYYRYNDRNFSIRKLPLTINEINEMKTFIIAISKISGRAEFDFLNEILPRLTDDYVYETKTAPIISYESNPYLKNYSLLTEIYHYIRRKIVLKLQYKPFHENKIILNEFHPWHLKQYNTRWFLFGYSPEFKDKKIHPVNLALDRIQKIEEKKGEYIGIFDIDFNNYFDDIIGVTKLSDKKITTIKLKIDKDRAPYIESKPIHSSQTKLIPLDKNHYTFTIKVIPNYELISVVNSYGGALKIIEPKSLSEEFNNS